MTSPNTWKPIEEYRDEDGWVTVCFHTPFDPYIPQPAFRDDGRWWSLGPTRLRAVPTHFKHFDAPPSEGDAS